MKTCHSQKGQAYTELLVSFLIIALLLLGSTLLWRYIETKQLLQSSARFALWERTVWEPEDNHVEKHALHRSESSLSKGVLIHQLSLPNAWRHERNGSAEPTVDQTRNMLKPALRAFVSNITDFSNLVSVETKNKRQRGAWVGQDPTMNTTTSLELDRDVYRTVKVSLMSKIPVSLNWQSGLFAFSTPNINLSQTMSIIANTWAASAPVNELRSDRQLGVLANGQFVSGQKPNFLVDFGQYNDPSSVSLGDFVGLNPWWNFVGGFNGLGGQYAVHKIGLNMPQVLEFFDSGEYPAYSDSKPLIENALLFKSQEEQTEYYTANQAATPNVRHSIIVDKTSDVEHDTPRNSVFKCCRKYMAFPISPDQFFGSTP